MPANPEYRTILNLVGAQTSQVIAGSELIVKVDEYIKVQWDEIPTPLHPRQTRTVVLTIVHNAVEQEN